MRRVLDVTVDKVMTSHPATVGGDASLEAAAGTMVEGGFRHLPVVDEEHRIVGILSERDMRVRLGVELERFPDADRDILAERVEALMHPDPVTVAATTSLRDVMEIISDERIGAVAVTDEGDRLVGVVSYVDVLAFLHEQDPPMPAARPQAGKARPAAKRAPERRVKAGTRRTRPRARRR